MMNIILPMYISSSISIKLNQYLSKLSTTQFVLNMFKLQCMIDYLFISRLFLQVNNNNEEESIHRHFPEWFKNYVSVI